MRYLCSIVLGSLRRVQSHLTFAYNEFFERSSTRDDFAHTYLGQRKVIFVIKLRNKEIKNLFTNRYCALIIQFERELNYFFPILSLYLRFNF